MLRCDFNKAGKQVYWHTTYFGASPNVIDIRFEPVGSIFLALLALLCYLFIE